VGSRRLTAWAMARPWQIVISHTVPYLPLFTIHRYNEIFQILIKKSTTPKNARSNLHLQFNRKFFTLYQNISSVQSTKSCCKQKFVQWIIFRKYIILLICRRQNILNLIYRYIPVLFLHTEVRKTKDSALNCSKFYGLKLFCNYLLMYSHTHTHIYIWRFKLFPVI
jgi:hypothetical protein